MKRSRLVAALSVLGMAGCYSYLPSSLVEVGPDQDVRARLAPEEAARLEDFVRGDTRSLEGTIVEQGPDSVLLLVETHSELRGVRVETLHQRLQVARSQILDLEVKRLDRGRTYLMTGAGVGAIAWLTVRGIFGNGGSSTEDPGTDPDETRIPFLSVRLPFSVFSLLGG